MNPAGARIRAPAFFFLNGMKLYHRLLTLLFAVLLPLSCNGDKPETVPEEPQSREFVSDGSFNADFVLSLAKAYDTFVETDDLPTSINVQGLNYPKPKYVAASCLLLDKMTTDPEHWTETEIELPTRAVGSVDYRWNTFFPDSLSFDEVKWMADKIYAYALEHAGGFPNYCTFPTKYVESDGTEHANQIYYEASAVIFARVFNAFVKNSEFPKTVSSWESDFLRKTTNCDTESSVVLAARDAALAHLPATATDRQKAEALFNYSRDEWEWLDYANTRRGSVQVVQDKGGNCCDLSHALIAMTRATGIPARYMHGQCQFSSSVIGHVFVEMYVDGQWFICDPSNNGNQFGTHNWTHMVTFNGRYKTLSF